MREKYAFKSKNETGRIEESEFKPPSIIFVDTYCPSTITVTLSPTLDDRYSAGLGTLGNHIILQKVLIRWHSGIDVNH